MMEYMVECSVDVELMDFLNFQKWSLITDISG